MKFRVIELFAFGLFIGSAAPKPEEQTCPTGVQKSNDCTNQKCTGANEICYKITDTSSICCAKQSFCPGTDMLTYFGAQTKGDITMYTYEWAAPKDTYWYQITSTVQGFTTQPACPRPLSFLFQSEYTDANKNNADVLKKVMPYDFDKNNLAKKLKKCKKNSDCDAGTFCGDVFNESDVGRFKGRDELESKFCYKLPIIPAPYTATTKYIVLANNHSLVHCNVNTDCSDAGAGPSAYCYRPGGTTTYSFSVKIDGAPPGQPEWETKTHNGLCVESNICTTSGRVDAAGKPLSFKWDTAGAPYQNAGNTGCNTDDECGDGGNTAPAVNTERKTYNNYCVKDQQKVPHGVCCYVELPPCKYGSTESPLASCSMKNSSYNTRFPNDGGFAECNGGLDEIKKQAQSSNKWCDYDNNVCCKNNEPTVDGQVQLQFCDDGQTPLFNEPVCPDARDGQETSGHCPKRGNDHTGAVCKNGHCCPSITQGANGLVLGKNSYVSNHPCTPGVRPPMFSAGFCDPHRKVVVLLGELSPQEEVLEKFPRDSPRVCHQDRDCSTDNSTLCLFIGVNVGDPGTCYFNPMVSVQKPANPLWLAVLITSVILAFVFLCTSICCMVLYRSKSVFDKYKPKKKGGKKGGKAGGKGSKGSKSKSSKKSKKSKKSKSKETETDTKSVTESKKSVMQ